jgi:hypothetical protein
MRWARDLARRGEMINSYKILIVNSEGKKTLGRPKH